ncbi:MAG: hypothetical protein E5Y81_19440, partial [Mesorhizobium sp.]
MAGDSVAGPGDYGYACCPRAKRIGQSKAPHRAVFLALSVVVPSLFLSACMSSEKDVDLSTYVEQTEPADVLYNQGLANLNAGRLQEASRKFS